MSALGPFALVKVGAQTGAKLDNSWKTFIYLLVGWLVYIADELPMVAWEPSDPIQSVS